MSLATVHYQDLTREGCGIFTFSSFWGEHWFKSMSQLRNDLIHEFGNDYRLIDMEDLTEQEFNALEAEYVGR